MKRLTNLFRTADGKNYAFTFMLVCTLFLLWGLCNGMIDVLNKHFQNSLNVTKAQSAMVQFAHYMGYFLMAIPSGLLARRYGYKGGILIGLGLIAVGAFLFIPATQINTFWAFLTALFILACGLTCLETIANPYTTVLGPSESGPTRINLAQSTNGIGWMIGPILGGMFILSATAEVNTSNSNLYIPYLLIAVVVTILFFLFARANIPDLHAMEESKTTARTVAVASGKPLFKRWHFVLAIVAQFCYVAAQTGVFSFFINYVVSDVPSISQGVAEGLNAFPSRFRVSSFPAAMLGNNDLAGDIKKHPELTTNVTEFVSKLQSDSDPRTQPVSQFLWSQISKKNQKFLGYPVLNDVARGQDNSRDNQKLLDELDASNFKDKQSKLVAELNRILEQNPALRIDDLQNPTGFIALFQNPKDSLSQYLAGEFSKPTKKMLAEWNPGEPPTNTLTLSVIAEINAIIRENPIYAADRFSAIKLDADTQAQVQKNLKGDSLYKLNRRLLEQAYAANIPQIPRFYDDKRFAGVNVSAETRKLIEQKPEGEALVRMNRRLLEDTYSDKYIARSTALQAPLFRISERGATILLSFGGFGLFLLGRFSGSAILGIFKAHTTLALYALINAVMMVLIMLPLGWFSVAALFASFFFMSIMFPTIFALGVRGLGEHTKIGSSLIVMSIVGGGLMPMFMGWLADVASMRFGFLMPLICFVVIFLYGAFWKVLEDKDTAGKPEAAAVPAH